MGASPVQDALPRSESLHSVLSYKRLEKGRFRLPRPTPEGRTVMVDCTELMMLLDGIDVRHVRRPKLWEPKPKTA